MYFKNSFSKICYRIETNRGFKYEILGLVGPSRKMPFSPLGLLKFIKFFNFLFLFKLLPFSEPLMNNLDFACQEFFQT